MLGTLLNFKDKGWVFRVFADTDEGVGGVFLVQSGRFLVVQKLIYFDFG